MEPELHSIKYNHNRHASTITKSQHCFSKPWEQQFLLPTSACLLRLTNCLIRELFVSVGFLCTQNENILAWVISSQKQAEFSCNVSDHMGICFWGKEGNCSVLQLSGGERWGKKRGDGGERAEKEGKTERKTSRMEAVLLALTAEEELQVEEGVIASVFSVS